MVLERERVYAPDEIISLSTSTPPRELNSQDRQQLYEARIVATMVKAIENAQSDTGVSKGIKLVGRYDQIPDVRIAYIDQKGREVDCRDVEVVSFTPFSETEGLVRFLGRTKLSPVFAYPDETIVLCFVAMPLKNPYKTAEKLSQVLAHNSKVRHQIYLLNESKEGQHFLASLHPFFEAYSICLRPNLSI